MMKNGEISYLMSKNIKEFFKPTLYFKDNLPEIFGELPVVGYLYEGMLHSITGESNRYEINYLIYTSQ